MAGHFRGERSRLPANGPSERGRALPAAPAPVPEQSGPNFRGCYGHFGFGPQTNMSTVEVSWPSGKKEVYRDLPADFIYTIVEGEGVQKKMPFAGQGSEKKQPTPPANKVPPAK